MIASDSGQFMMAPAIITLDNFASKMPPWNPNLENHLYALVDMGRCVISVLCEYGYLV